MFLDYEQNQKLNLHDEESLQMACVKYLRTCDLLFTSNGLEECLNTDEKRVKSYKLGYLKGCPDLIIFTPNKTYNMLVFELKTVWGNGTLSSEQSKVLHNLETECKTFCCVINSIETFVEIVVKYVNDLL